MKLNKKEAIFQTINTFVLVIYTFLCLYPFYRILIYSFSDSQLAAKTLVVFFPAGFTFNNFSRVFQLKGILNSSFISVARSVLGAVITTFCSSMFGYILTKPKYFMRKTIYRMVIITMYFDSGLIPWFITMKYLGLKNNFLLYILPSAVVVFYLILVKTYIEQLPAAIEESAMIDGAGYFTIFIKIIFPLSVPIIATVATFSAVNQWNSWTDNFFLVSDPKLQTLQLTLLNMMREAEALVKAIRANESGVRVATSPITPSMVRMTLTMVVTLPILAVYPFLQRYMVKGIMLGAVKA